MIPENFKIHYRKILGTERAEIFFDYCQKPLKKCVRINPLLYTTKEFETLASENNWDIKPVPWCNTGYFLERKPEDRFPLGNISEHLLGGIYIQEASSMLPITALFHNTAHANSPENVEFSEKVICDVASAPGSKTTQLAAEMQGEGILVSNELSTSRLKALYSNIERCGVENALLTNYDGENLCNLLPETFDFLLLDAPCTGEGTIRKNANALENWTELDAPRMGNLQKKLIRAAFVSLKEGGEMVYSTCTLARSENEEVIEFLQEEFPNQIEILSLRTLFEGAEKATTPEGFLCIWPEIFDSEGFFVAKIRKTKSSLSLRERELGSEENFQKNLRNFPFEKILQNEENQLKKFFREQWGYEISGKNNDNTKIFWKRDNTIWAFPKGSENIFSRIKCDRIGIPLVDTHKKGWRTRYEACSALGKNFTKNTSEISGDQFKKIYKGEDLTFDRENGEILCLYKKFPVSLGKITKGKWKNALPRVLIRSEARG